MSGFDKRRLLASVNKVKEKIGLQEAHEKTPLFEGQPCPAIVPLSLPSLIIYYLVFNAHGRRFCLRPMALRALESSLILSLPMAFSCL